MKLKQRRKQIKKINKTINMNSQEYIEVSIKITPYNEENADIVTAEISELPYVYSIYRNDVGAKG